MVELFFNRIILRIQHMTPDCTRQRVPMFFFQRRVTRKTTSSRATETCAYIVKKTKTNPRVKASKSERCWRGGLYLTVYNSELCSETKRQNCHFPVDFVDDIMSWNTDYCQREMCVHVHYNELVSCNVWTMFYRLWIFIREFNHHVVYPIGLFIFFLFHYICVLFLCLECVHEFLMLTTSHFGLVHDYMELFENFDTGMIIFQVSCWKFFLKDLVPFCLHELFYHSCETHREIMCCTRKLYRLILYEYFIWIENIEASMQIDNPALHVLHVVLSQIF